jgi:hypothetical protein
LSSPFPFYCSVSLTFSFLSFLWRLHQGPLPIAGSSIQYWSLILVSFPLHPGFSPVLMWRSYHGPWKHQPDKRLPPSTNWVDSPVVFCGCLKNTQVHRLRGIS